FDRLARRFRRRREKWSDIDVEAEIGKRRGDHLLAAVMAVLANLGNEDARAAAFGLLECGGELLDARDGVRHAGLPLVDARYRLDLGLMAAEHVFERRGDLADRGPGTGGVDRERQQVDVAARGVARECRERLRDGLRVALALEALELRDLKLTHRRVVDLEELDHGLFARAMNIDADHRLQPLVDARLRAGGGFLDAQLRQSRFNRLGHATR